MHVLTLKKTFAEANNSKELIDQIKCNSERRHICNPPRAFFATPVPVECDRQGEAASLAFCTLPKIHK